MDTRSKVKKSKTAEQFFKEMYRDLRAWNRDVPESPERVDPILRILLQLYSHQLAEIDERIDETWQVATNSVIEALAPEAKRWPIPAYTVMRCEPADPVVEIDPHTKFFYKETREGGRTFFFSAQRTERLLAANVRHAFLQQDGSIVDILATPDRPASAGATAGQSGTEAQLILAIEFAGPASNFANAAVFLKSDEDALEQIRWGSWQPSAKQGAYNDDADFCPGMTTSIEELFSGVGENPIDWGGFRSSTDLFKQLEHHWVVIPPRFASRLEARPIDPDLKRALDRARVECTVPDEGCYWIKIDLPSGGDKARLRSPLGVSFSSFVATNRNELNLFRHTGGDSLVEIELAEPIDTILDVVKIEDSRANEYAPRHLIQPGTKRFSYTMEQRNSHLVLWFDLTSSLELPPDSLTVTYSITDGVAANGIAEGKITELYESHPGINSAENVLPVRGAVPARTDEQLVTEISTRLRNRDRALSFAALSDWSTTFDPRIRRAICGNGIERTRRGVRRCIVVKVTVKQDDFYSEDETQLLAQRLARFLKSRSPVNTQYRVEVATV